MAVVVVVTVEKSMERAIGLLRQQQLTTTPTTYATGHAFMFPKVQNNPQGKKLGFLE